ncbi:hypothetical protein SAMN05444287_0122 [Octadecabacter temperatus]|uniref:Uncharacterized protein n=1 Tax=Octadecabacter temperatus TaxID=1458307 RepID=A0A0K0Y274_9RHOB|nr:hypothetical protein [Octadecabacter temperatus]AKS45034.1 hypothetical protein OSB_04710 [Octadecabacter temperatus]SIN84889.1 hypothetical protein SAMN05444287_0122 [Octadecabacter temperatus]
MRFIIPAAIVGITVAAAARADTEYSAMIRDLGLSQTKSALSEISNPTPSDRFALGGVHFLSVVEQALQTQYRVGVDQEMAEMSGLPFLRLPVAQNPSPEGFYPEVIEEIFTAALADLDGALDQLDEISDGDDVGVVINTADLWFDINMNGTYDAGESLFEVAGGDLNRGLDTDFVPPIVRFDTSDAAWLSAYAHLLSGVSETILAVSPSQAIERVTTSAAVFQEMGRDEREYLMFYDEDRWLDMAAMFIHAIEGPVDVDRSRAAHTHFLGMIQDNKVFWDRVSRENDNDREWIPNKAQDSALPIPFPADLGDQWRNVLTEAEMMLNGELLIPHWRLPEGMGINVAAFMQNPPELDIIALIQGESILPYVERGPEMSGQAWRSFERMVGGDAAFYAVILN